jgi:hypothetical protein
MRINVMNALIFLAVITVGLASCKKEDLGNAAEFADLVANPDNAFLTLSFNVGVFANDNGTGSLDNSALNVIITGGVATLVSYTVEHQAGAPTARINLVLNGAANGSEVVTVATTANTIFTTTGVAMAANTSRTVNLNETGIIGRWQSSGANVAPLLRNTGIDSIYAEFRTDNTYIVRAFQADGSSTTLTGTFGQQRSNTGNIYNITVTQNSPTSLISQGIFAVAIENNQTTMQYEVAQTDPNIPGVTPPTAAGGFGSTSGGAFGVLNVQKYVKL